MKIMKIQFVLALAQRNKLFDFFFDILNIKLQFQKFSIIVLPL
jgi:hypothetical protein